MRSAGDAIDNEAVSDSIRVPPRQPIAQMRFTFIESAVVAWAGYESGKGSPTSSH